MCHLSDSAMKNTMAAHFDAFVVCSACCAASAVRLVTQMCVCVRLCDGMKRRSVQLNVRIRLSAFGVEVVERFLYVMCVIGAGDLWERGRSGIVISAISLCLK